MQDSNRDICDKVTRESNLGKGVGTIIKEMKARKGDMWEEWQVV